MVVGDVATGTELAVVGAGPGGYVAAIRAAQLGVDTTLIEKDELGGTCLNVGCIPSKALIHATNVGYEADTAEEMGIHADVKVDMEQMVDWKDGVVDQLTSGVEKLCKANGVNIVHGRAEFAGENRLRVAHGGEGQGSETIEFEQCVVATGSRPIEIPGFAYDDDPVLDSTQLLALEQVPRSLVVVGGGYIGMELSTILAKMGCDVTVVEMMDDILPGYEEDVKRVVRKRAEELGVDFYFGQAAKGWERADDAGIVVTTENEDGEESTFDAEKAFVAVGRQPVLDTLNLDAAGLEPNEQGRLETDHTGETNVDGIFAIGDVAPGPQLAHKASKEGQVVAEVVAGEPAAMDYQAVPAAVFTDPEIATVGLTQAEAEEEGFTPAVGKFPFSASGRALTTNDHEGFVRIVADGDSGFILGAQIVGPEASELIAELGLAVEMGATLEDIAATIHTHPTLSEGVMEAAEHALGHAIHTLNR
ncbi:dihydrolipoyl dehydrogenase [Halocalculus aciditolerans]|uniref:Dihydrolipoyl dehydrogenase n=1 Tax=Halocalculus aciditolerans TaxID=1383812 RepID=A0A830FE09_9EURY|nr:dihydrolipoyl dehydrogenase [Halocalculus aciditolerans]GGL45794.1 dihydrolipoamide dehydrogenase [Halocalculus aciditolerans]